MAVFRVEKNSGYTVMSNHHLRNRALSLKAKGLLSQMLSLPEDWDYTLQGLARINRESIDAIRQAIRELEQAGYIQRSRERDEKGRLRGADYVIFELPQPVPASVSPTLENPTLENPTQENPTLENPMQLNKDKLITEKQKKEGLNTDSIPIHSPNPLPLDEDEAAAPPPERTGSRKETAYQIYRDLILENIEYDTLTQNPRIDREQLDEIVDILLETVCTSRKSIRVAGDDYPAELVKAKFLKLDSHHIEFVMDCLRDNTTKVRNIKQQKDPDHFAVRQYKKFLLSAGKTRSSILISCGARLAPFDIREVRELMEDDEMELDTIGDEKTILFLIMSDTDTTFNFILAMLQSQLINLLCDRADDKYGGRLPVHVRLILDEFANIGQIPNFDKLIATIRSREISASIILQSQSQLKAIYKDAAEIISDNCDSVLFLSGRGKNAKEISDALGKETIDSFNTSENRGSQTSHGLNYQKLGKALMSEDEIAIMDGGRCILQLRGVRPFFSEKFDITKHPHYKYLADADKKNTIDVDRFLSTLRRKRQQVVAQDESFDLYEIDLSDEAAAAE